jgi:hypothetical protein
VINYSKCGAHRYLILGLLKIKAWLLPNASKKWGKHIQGGAREGGGMERKEHDFILMLMFKKKPKHQTNQLYSDSVSWVFRDVAYNQSWPSWNRQENGSMFKK